jgi:hypothetical protein
MQRLVEPDTRLSVPLDESKTRPNTPTHVRASRTPDHTQRAKCAKSAAYLCVFLEAASWSVCLLSTDIQVVQNTPTYVTVTVTVTLGDSFTEGLISGRRQGRLGPKYVDPLIM